MQLLDSCPLPQVQFASLSVLIQLQLHPDDEHETDRQAPSRDENDPTILKNVSSDDIESAPEAAEAVEMVECRTPEGGLKTVPLYPKGLAVYYKHTATNAKTSAVIVDVHMDDLLEPYYSIRLDDGREKQTDNAHLRLDMAPTEETDEGDDADVGGTEADKSAGPPAARVLTHAVLKKDLTIITPLTLLPEDACKRSMESLHQQIMGEFGMRDDFLGINAVTSGDGEADAGKENRDGNGKEESSEEDAKTPTRVRFHDDTKEGAAQDPPVANATPQSSEQAGPFGSQLPVRAYQPPSHHLNFSPGLTMFYAAVYVEDVSKAADPENDSGAREGDALRTLRHCTSVLLPGHSLKAVTDSVASSSGTRGGVILVTVGTTGPAYDLYGASSVIATLPERLRQSMSTLAALDTTPKKIQVMDNSRSEQGNNKKPKGMNGGPVQPRQQTISYDTEYFKQLYKALLATLVDDEDGLMRDHDAIHDPTLLQPSTPAVPQSLAESTQNVTGSSTVRKKRFTFSRRKGKKGNSEQAEYESGDMISGGDDVPLDGGKSAFESAEQAGINNAEIVRRTAQQLELLSIVEEDMALPKYSHAGDGIGKGSKRVPSSPTAAKSPRRAKAGRSGTVTGRFGRPGVPSDLSGFEYRPPSHPQQIISGGGSISGTASTSMMGTSDDASIQTGGDDTATISSRYTAGSSSQFSVPTLSKPKRDSSKSVSSRSRFLQRKKKEVKSPANTKGSEAAADKPPLFPQQPQPVYDPFSVEEDEVYGVEEKAKTENVVDSPVSVSTKGTAQTPTASPEQGSVPSPPLSAPSTPQEMASSPQMMGSAEAASPKSTGSPQVFGSPQAISNVISRSLSQESEGAITEGSEGVHSTARSAASVPESPASVKEEATPSTPVEPAAELEEVEPTRYLDVGLALNEDLTCEYKKSKLSSLTVEGTVQVRVKSRYEEEATPQQQQQPTIPFFLVFQDHSGHIRALQENKKFVENVTHEADVANREFTYTINVPREEEYFSVVRYKCGNTLRPVPIRVQSRVRTQGKHCRIALQISSNPQNPSDLVHLTIIMSVPDGVRGDTLQCNPPGGVFNESKRVVLWCVSELGGGEKFQLQSIFEIEDELLNEGGDALAEKLEFPVLARCQCSNAQLSDVKVEVSADMNMFPAAVSTSFLRRFRVSHKESNR